MPRSLALPYFLVLSGVSHHISQLGALVAVDNQDHEDMVFVTGQKMTQLANCVGVEANIAKTKPKLTSWPLYLL
jgi:hypothetical protein